MLIVSILAVLFHFALAAPAPEKVKIDTSILHKMRQNESLLATTGVANDFLRRVSTTAANAYTEEEDFFNPHKAGNVEDCEGVMAMLSVTLKDPVYRRRWQDLVYMGHRVLLDALLKTTDPTFYIKDVMDMMHTVEGQHTWRRIQLFVKSWSGTEDFYRFIQMIDMVPGDTMFKDVSVAQQYFHYARTTTSRLILPTSASHILTEQGIIIPDF